MSNPVPGWYTDPLDGSQQRFWDGTEWTEQVQSFNPQLGLPQNGTTTPQPGASSPTPVADTPAVAPIQATQQPAQVNVGFNPVQQYSDYGTSPAGYAPTVTTTSTPKVGAIVAIIVAVVVLVAVVGGIISGIMGGSSLPEVIEDEISDSQREKQRDEPFSLDGDFTPIGTVVDDGTWITVPKKDVDGEDAIVKHRMKSVDLATAAQRDAVIEDHEEAAEYENIYFVRVETQRVEGAPLVYESFYDFTPVDKDGNELVELYAYTADCDFNYFRDSDPEDAILESCIAVGTNGALKPGGVNYSDRYAQYAPNDGGKITLILPEEN